MGSAPPANLFNNDPEYPSGPAQPSLQGGNAQVPRWNLEYIHTANPRDLYEEQTEFLAQILGKEIHDHNTTRTRLYRYLSLFLKHERGHCSEHAHVQYLNMVIHDLRTKLQREKMERRAAEEAHAMVRDPCLDDFSCVRHGTSTKMTTQYLTTFKGYPAMNDPEQQSAPSLGEDVNDSAPLTSTQYVHPPDINLYRLEQLAHYAGESSRSQEATRLPEMTNWALPGQGSPEKFALEDHELEDGDKGKQALNESDEQKACPNADDGSVEGQAPKRCKRKAT